MERKSECADRAEAWGCQGRCEAEGRAETGGWKGASVQTEPRLGVVRGGARPSQCSVHA